MRLRKLKIDEVESFWGLGETSGKNKKNYSKNADWLGQMETENIEINHQVWPQITLEETKTAIKKASKWKASGNTSGSRTCLPYTET